MLKKLLLGFFCIIQLLVPQLTSANVQLPAKPAGNQIYLQDYAQVITQDTAAKINALGRELDEKTGAQIVAVTLPTLNGAAIEDYSLALLRAWGIGEQTKNNGVLILVAVNDRQSRIEVGYGLEGALPDGLTGRIQDTAMLPYFQAGDYDRGLWEGYAATAALTAKEYKVTLSSAPVADTAAKDNNALTSANKIYALIIIGILLLLDQVFLGGSILNLLLLLLLRGGRGGGGRGGGGFGGGSGGGGGSSRRW